MYLCIFVNSLNTYEAHNLCLFRVAMTYCFQLNLLKFVVDRMSIFQLRSRRQNIPDFLLIEGSLRKCKLILLLDFRFLKICSQRYDTGHGLARSCKSSYHHCGTGQCQKTISEYICFLGSVLATKLPHLHLPMFLGRGNEET